MASTGKRDTKGKGRGKDFVEGSIDSVCMLDDQRFVSGGDSGWVSTLSSYRRSSDHSSLCLWQTAKKKPIYTQPLAHGVDNLLHEDNQSIVGPRWITAIGALRSTDLFATGKFGLSYSLQGGC
jgi:ribosomal RNA-processing protein 9